jgi:putative tryptophan/tyrosine transport system substrate-binding protein
MRPIRGDGHVVQHRRVYRDAHPELGRGAARRPGTTSGEATAGRRTRTGSPTRGTGQRTGSIPPGPAGAWLRRGHSIALEVRWDEHHPERWPDLAAALVQLPVDILVAGTTSAALAAQHTTGTIPIVIAVSADPVGDGLVASLARPGGNITGLSSMTYELTGKRLELLTEVVPGLARVAVLLEAGNPSRHAQWQEHEAAARMLGMQLLPLEVRGPDEFAGAFQAAIQGQAQALIVMQCPLFTTHRARLAELALASRLPTMSGNVGYAKAGGLMNYGPNLPESWRRAATYVHKILKGAKPADLPVEQPRTFELIINLKAARALGITMPPTLLLLADEAVQ